MNLPLLIDAPSGRSYRQRNHRCPPGVRGRVRI